MDIGTVSVPVLIALGLAGVAASGGAAWAGTWFAFRSELALLKQRMVALENQKNDALELRMANIEDKLRLEKFEEFWQWRTTVNSRLDALEKRT